MAVPPCQALPWRPRLDLDGRTRYTLGGEGGRISSYDEAWAITPSEALWMLVVRARARARQRHALAGRFARRMVALRLLRAWRQVTRPLASSSGSVSGSGSGASGTERGVAAAREHARLLAIRAVVARADGGPAVVERAQQLPAQDRHRSRGEQPPLDQP